MPKLKTRKSLVKRIKVTKTGKVLKKKAGQGHFNSRENSKITRKKRKTTIVSKSNIKALKKVLPHSF